MKDAICIATDYINLWNEREAGARLAKATALFADQAAYLDPMMKGDGHDGIASMIGAAQQHFPGHQFALRGVPDGHNDVVRFSWTLGLPDGATVAIGTDIGYLDVDGRLNKVTGFLDALDEAKA